MPKVPITMPQLGESMAEATIVAIKIQPGDKVSADQEIIEVETDKAVMGVTTPCAGEIAKIDAEVKGTYAVGAVLGYVEASEADAARFQKRAPQPPKGEVAKEVPGREEESAVRTQDGSGSHFQIDENGLPPVAAASSAVLACLRRHPFTRGPHATPRVHRPEVADVFTPHHHQLSLAGSWMQRTTRRIILGDEV
jgi:pyruvate/2-oxoglutarate dehydrogenase complex dihydrolipoamide acyltransferase (E2) component